MNRMTDSEIVEAVGDYIKRGRSGMLFPIINLIEKMKEGEAKTGEPVSMRQILDIAEAFHTLAHIHYANELRDRIHMRGKYAKPETPETPATEGFVAKAIDEAAPSFKENLRAAVVEAVKSALERRTTVLFRDPGDPNYLRPPNENSPCIPGPDPPSLADWCLGQTIGTLNAIHGIAMFCGNMRSATLHDASQASERQEVLDAWNESHAHPKHHGEGWRYHSDGCRDLRGGHRTFFILPGTLRLFRRLVGMYPLQKDASNALCISASTIGHIMAWSGEGKMSIGSKVERAVIEEVKHARAQGHIG